MPGVFSGEAYRGVEMERFTPCHIGGTVQMIFRECFVSYEREACLYIHALPIRSEPKINFILY
jgi:hypothetical protein